MATATRSATATPSTRRNVPAEIDVTALPTAEIDATAGAPPLPTDAPAGAPTLQDALRADAPAPTDAPTETKPAESGDGNAIVFLSHVNALVACITRQSAALVAWYVERGRHVREGINVKVAKSVNKQTRDKNRASAVAAMTIAAESTYDATAESKPNLAIWIALHALAERFPNAINLPSVKVARALAETMSRVDPPASWDAPETFDVRPRYNHDAVRILIDRAVSENLTEDEVSAEIERIGGVVAPDAPAEKTTDPVKAARQLAASILERITDRKIDPETFFDELGSQLTKYGWSLVKGRDAKGAETFKPIKVGK